MSIYTTFASVLAFAQRIFSAVSESIQPLSGGFTMPSHSETVGPYAITRLKATSRVLEHFSSPLVQISIIMSVILEIAYFLVSFYVGATIPGSKANADLTWRMWAVIFAQVSLWLVDMQARFDQYIPILLRIRLQDRPRYRLVGRDAPNVDVLIFACGEDVNIAMHTVAAAAAQVYPFDRFNVFLLDDGEGAELRGAVDLFNTKQKNCGAKGIRYLSRKKLPGVPTHFKAGNLNFGLKEAKRLSGAEFVACLDVDMIPRSNWLRAMLPHLLLDEKVGIATPPQKFYNLPRRDLLTQGASIPAMLTAPLRDGMENASCDGSGFVLRRETLQAIGEWPTNSVSDDSMCSRMLLAAGWKLVFVNEELQTGLLPDTMTAGNVQVARAFRFYLPGQKVSANFTLPQRLSLGVDALVEYTAFLVCLSALLLPIAIWPTETSDFTNLVLEPNRRLLGWAFLISHFASRLNNYIVYGIAADAYLQNGKRAKYWTVPYTIVAVIRVYWPGAQILSPSTGTISSNLKERSRIYRRPFTERFLSSGTTMHLIYVMIGIAPLYLRLREFYQSGFKGHFPFPGALLQLAECVLMVSTPLFYMGFPPTVPELADLLEVGEDGLTRLKARDEEPEYKLSMMAVVLWDIAVVLLCVN